MLMVWSWCSFVAICILLWEFCFTVSYQWWSEMMTFRLSAWNHQMMCIYWTWYRRGVDIAVRARDGKEGLWQSVTPNWVGSSNDFPSKSEYWLQTCLPCGCKLFVYWLICLSITLKSAITLVCWIYLALCPLCQYASSTTQLNCVKLHTSERALIVANMKMIVAALIARIHIFVWSSLLLYLRKMAMYDLLAVSLLSYIYWFPHLSSLTRTWVVLSFHF
jgi:hypothetical protein